MNALRLFFYYIKWHYGRAVLNGFHIWKNFVWFLSEFFSLRVLEKTFFKPFEYSSNHTYRSQLPKEEVINLVVLSIFGILMRSVTIIFGIFSLLISVALGALVFILWIILPALVILSLYIGIDKLI